MNNKYDVIVIGAGIGGLTCGAYLSKDGLKVLVMEQHRLSGGYCGSFKRGDFTFDVGVHYLGSCSKGRMLSKVFNELEIEEKLLFKRANPSDLIVLPDFEVPIKNDILETADTLSKIFPKEKENIYGFFKLIRNKNFLEIYLKFRNKTFKDCLDEYFSDNKIKSFFKILLGNIGLPSTKVAAVTGIVMYRQFVLDGGFYPVGGMQVLPNLLVDSIENNGGKVLCSKKVVKVLTAGSSITSVIDEDDVSYSADYFVSNVDPVEFFSYFDESNILRQKHMHHLEKLTPSISAFIVYLGVESERCSYRSSVWKFDDYDIDRIYLEPFEGEFDRDLKYLICTFPSIHDSSLAPRGHISLSMLLAAPFKKRNEGKNFWNIEKNAIADKMIAKLKKEVLRDLGEIKVKAIATPLTLERYTKNQNGSLYGWASTVDQISADLVPQKTFFNNLWLAGHWTTPGLGQGGITGVAFSGRKVAKHLIKLLHRVKI